jgi:cellobiose-specific phosphotransferase system component IIA
MQLRKSSSEFSATADSLGKAYGGAVHQAREAINAIRASTNSAHEAARELLTTYQGEYRRSVLLLTGCSLVVGTLLGTILDHWAFR